MDTFNSYALSKDFIHTDNSSRDEKMISKKWYDFLDSLNAKLSEYEIQKNRKIYNVAVIEDWGNPGKKQGIDIKKHNVGKFLSKIVDFNLAGYDETKNISLTDRQLEELNHVLRSSLDYKVYVECIESFLFIKGNYISIGENVNHVLQSLRDRKIDFCSSSILDKLKYVSIFALDTLFIDQDMELTGSQYPITLIASKWNIIGHRRINLNGTDGKMDIGTSIVSFTHSIDGEPGKPGGPGGYLFGIGAQFRNGTNLTISADGGKGSSGRDGGDGESGKDGLSPEKPSQNTPVHKYHSCKTNKKVDSFSCEEISSYYSTSGSSVTFKVYGKSGTKGGNGGNGGKSGKGGKPGTIKMFELNSNSNISKSNQKGADGKNGRGGIGGLGGKNGDDIVIRYYLKVRETSPNSFDWEKEWLLDQRIDNGRSSSGKNGIDGTNIRKLQEPEDGVNMDGGEAKILNEYKKYSRENMKDCLKKLPLVQFLNQLERSDEVNKIYDTFSLARELQDLEMQFPELHNDVDLEPFYQSLLKRVDGYAKNPAHKEVSNEYRKVLAYIYTATLSRIYNIKDDTESNLVLDINGYLNLVKKSIEELKDLRKLNNKAIVINRYKENYKSNIDSKIKEARFFIEQKISPEIDKIGTKIDTKIELLIEETIKLQNQAKQEHEKLKNLKLELQKALELRGFFNCFKIIGQVVSFLGPYGEIAGTVIGGVSTIFESLVLDDKNEFNTLELPKSVLFDIQSRVVQIKNAQNQKITHLKSVLEQISKSINDYPKELNDMSDKIADIKNKSDKFDSSKFKFRDLQKLEEELMHELKRKEADLKQINIKYNQKYANLLKVVEKFKQSIQIMQVGVDLFAKYKKDQTSLNLIDDAIEKTEQKYEMLKQFEEFIYENIIPMMKNMSDELDEVVSKLSTKSKVSLGVIRWQIQSNLRDLKLRIRQQTEGFKCVEDDLPRGIEKLEEAMTSLINVYNHIQNYQEQQNLANYVADISSTMANSIVVADSELSLAVNDLERVIRSNMVLKHYKIAVDAFKQFVFPFAHIYLKKLKLPSSFEGERNFENLVTEAVRQIENVALQVHIYRTSVKGHDQYIFTGEFTSNYISTKPFFVWKKEHYTDILSKLLSGQEVVLKADVTSSPIKRDAIKFSSIDLYFKAQNKTIQYQINDKLKAFGVSATHLGNSYYRYQDKYYQITSDSQTLVYSFEKNDAGEPVSKNRVYDKIKDGDFMLSPYAIWKIKLIDYVDSISFSDLEIYNNQVDLELVGLGNYVYIASGGLDLRVESYYRAVDGFHTQEVETESNSTAYLCSLKNKNAKRFKRGISVRKEKNPEFSSNKNPNAESSSKKYKKSEISNWLSWLQLPSFSILPGADAVFVEEKKERNKARFDNWNCLFNSEQSVLPSTHQEDLFLEDVEEHNKPLTNEVKPPLEEVEPNIPESFTDNIGQTYNTCQNMLVFHPERVKRECAISGISFSSEGIKNGKILHTRNMIDLSHNLFFGQLVTHKLFGKNELLSSIDYISPEQEHEMKINELTSKVLPIIAADEWYDDER